MEKGKWTEQDMMEAVYATKGHPTQMAQMLGCSTTTVYNYIKRYPALAEAMKTVRNIRHDFVKSKLFEKIEEGNLTAIIFYLKSQCGWYDRPIQQLPGKWKDFDPDTASDEELREFINDIGG